MKGENLREGASGTLLPQSWERKVRGRSDAIRAFLNQFKLVKVGRDGRTICGGSFLEEIVQGLGGKSKGDHSFLG